MVKKSSKSKLGPAKFCFLHEMGIEEGLAFIDEMNQTCATEPTLYGRLISRDSTRLNILFRSPLKCYCCNKVATHFIFEQHRNDRSKKYRMNLYSGNVMMTWDHIIPKSFGGSDDLANARVACEKCNSIRGNEMTLLEMIWVSEQNILQIYTEYPDKTRSLAGLIATSMMFGEEVS